MLHGDGKVLITAEVGGPTSADFTQGIVPPGLGPGIGVEIGEKAILGRAMKMDSSTEGGGGENGFHFCSGPVLRPVVEELELAIAEEFEAFDVD